MENIEVIRRILKWLIACSSFWISSGVANATTFIPDRERSVNGTVQAVAIIEAPLSGGEKYTLTYTDKKGVTKTIPFPSPSNQYGLAKIAVTDARSGTKLIVNNITEGTTGTLIASVFDPPSNIAVSDFVLGERSEITFGGEQYSLTGGFTAIQNQLDSDIFSSTYGVETGYIKNSNIRGIGQNGQFDLIIESAFTATDLSAAWSIINQLGYVPDAGISIAQTFSFLGKLSLNGAESPIQGSFTGDVLFNKSGLTTSQGTLNFINSQGAGSGYISASAIPEISPIPEPGSIVLILTGLLTLWGRARSVAVAARGREIFEEY